MWPSKAPRRAKELRRSLQPVGFGAAYKILDMLLEHVLRANGGVRMSFAQKTQALSTRPTTLPVPFDRSPGLWARLAPLYRGFQEARHAVIHRRAQVTRSGDLEVYADSRTLIDTIAGPELAAFAAAVHTLAEAVVDIDADERRANIAAWHLKCREPGRHQSGEARFRAG